MAISKTTSWTLSSFFEKRDENRTSEMKTSSVWRNSVPAEGWGSRLEKGDDVRRYEISKRERTRGDVVAWTNCARTMPLPNRRRRRRSRDGREIRKEILPYTPT